MNKVIYSVLLDNYDSLNKAPQYIGWDVILFTNLTLPDYKGWTVIKVKTNNPKKDSRKYKWLSHIHLKEYDLVCYMDANMLLRKEPPSKPIWFRHPTRRSVSQEMARILDLDKESEDIIYGQFDDYETDGFNDRFGLYQNGFFVRDNKNPKINELHEAVFEIINKWSYRDQIALPFAIFKTGTTPENIYKGEVSSQYFKLKHHYNPNGSTSVHHITPGRADKNLGLAINQLIEFLPDNDWICVRDIDTIPTCHTEFFNQCEAIARANEFDLVGCMTNRLGLDYQLHNGLLSEETDYLKHKEIGKERFDEHGNKVIETNKTLAGLFMLFPKKTWLSVGKFPEGGIQINGKFIDYHFSKSVLDNEMKLGIALGIYLFHDYRLGMGNPKGNIKHLI